MVLENVTCSARNCADCGSNRKMSNGPRSVSWKTKDKTDEEIMDSDTRNAAASDAKKRMPKDGIDGHADIKRPEHDEPNDDDNGSTVKCSNESIAGPTLQGNSVGKPHRDAKGQSASGPSRGCAKKALFHGRGAKSPTSELTDRRWNRALVPNSTSTVR